MKPTPTDTEKPRRGMGGHRRAVIRCYRQLPAAGQIEHGLDQPGARLPHGRPEFADEFVPGGGARRPDSETLGQFDPVRRGMRQVDHLAGARPHCAGAGPPHLDIEDAVTAVRQDDDGYVQPLARHGPQRLQGVHGAAVGFERHHLAAGAGQRGAQCHRQSLAYGTARHREMIVPRGVGSIAIDALAAKGYQVAAITGKRESEAYLRALGATQILHRDELRFEGQALESARWGGAIDNAGGELLSWLLRTTHELGNVASIGLAAGAELHTTVMPFILRGVSLLGVNSSSSTRETRLQVWSRLSTDLKPPHLDRIVTRTIERTDLPAAFDDYLKGRITGRTVVRME